MAGRNVQKARQIDIRKATSKQLREYIVNEGKRLNQQIVTLEKRGLEKSSFAYQNLIGKSSNRPWLGKNKSGYMKVNLSTRGLSKQKLQQLAGVIQGTVTTQTITPSGIQKYYSRVFDSLRQRYPEMNKFSDEELSDIFTTMGFKSAMTTLGSDRLMQMISHSKDATSIEQFLEGSNGYETVLNATDEYNRIMGYTKKDGNAFVYTKTSPFDGQS